MASLKNKPDSSEEITAKEESPVEEVEVSCYIGPTIVGVIQANTIYAGSVKDALEKIEVKWALEKHPGIAKLIVSGAELAEARKLVKTKGTDLYKAYRAVLRNK